MISPEAMALLLFAVAWREEEEGTEDEREEEGADDEREKVGGEISTGIVKGMV